MLRLGLLELRLVFNELDNIDNMKNYISDKSHF